MDPRARVAAWLDALPEDRRRALARRYADELFASGLAVYRADEDRFTPIAPSLSPEPISDDALTELARRARLLLSATVKAVRYTLGQPRLAERLYHGFTPLEKECLADPTRLERIATARGDFFWRGDSAQALELNATIPAMQGYSDLAAHAWLRHVGREIGLDPTRIEALVRASGSNTADLLASIVAHHRKAGGRGDHPSILIVSRRGDSQLGELRHYERAFAAAGHRALHVWVDEVALDADGRLSARGERFDVLYRHIFARRVEPGSVMDRLLRDPGPNLVLNPVVSPLEVKGVLALLSDPPAAIDFSDDERDMIARSVPWTRLLDPGPATLPDGSQTADLPAWVAENRRSLVIKRSWDYGGKGVHLGPDTDDWAARVAAGARDENAWVVQELIPPVPVRHLLVVNGEAAWRDVFVDISAYANLGVDPRPRGGVCRASGSKIVNIALGGGVAPLIQSSILEKLFPSS